MKCFCGCGNEGKARDVGGTVYHLCDECWGIHLWANAKAVQVARAQVADIKKKGGRSWGTVMPSRAL